MAFQETVFRLNIGVDTYEADISDQNGLKFKRLKNVKPERGRLVCPEGLSVLQTIAAATGVRSFAFYTVPTTQFTSLYAIDNTSIYPFVFSGQEFNDTPIYTGFPDTVDPYAKTPWLDAAYVTKRGGRLVRLRNNTATVVADAPGARYMIIADSHLMLANTTLSGVSHPVRVQWSDLYAPESFVIGPASEADFFELSPDDGEVTGLSYQRGATLTYTRDRIWVARYLKGSIDAPGKYQFDVLFTGVGNVYHDAQIRIKEVDYFIGSDNIYKLDGFQLKKVGDPIWEYFQATIVNTNFQNSVIAVADLNRSEVAWIYEHVTEGRWSIVYNFDEDKWCDRDPEDVNCRVDLKFPVRGYISIDETSPTTFNDWSTGHAIDGEWQYLPTSIRTLLGGSTGKIYQPSSPATYVKSDNSAFSCEMETFEFDADKIEFVKEFDKLRPLFSSRDYNSFVDSDLKLYIGTRNHRATAIVWSTAIPLSDMFTNDPTLFFRNKGVGKLVRFRLVWTNNTTYAITELVKLGLAGVEQNGNTNPEK